jgi:hypothetical protein
VTKRYADGRGNPPESPWRDGGPRASRRRRKRELSMAESSWAALDTLAERHDGNASRAANARSKALGPRASAPARKRSAPRLGACETLGSGPAPAGKPDARPSPRGNISPFASVLGGKCDPSPSP